MGRRSRLNQFLCQRLALVIKGKDPSGRKGWGAVFVRLGRPASRNPDLLPGASPKNYLLSSSASCSIFIWDRNTFPCATISRSSRQSGKKGPVILWDLRISLRELDITSNSGLRSSRAHVSPFGEEANPPAILGQNGISAVH